MILVLYYLASYGDVETSYFNPYGQIYRMHPIPNPLAPNAIGLGRCNPNTFASISSLFKRDIAKTLPPKFLLHSL